MKVETSSKVRLVAVVAAGLLLGGLTGARVVSGSPHKVPASTDLRVPRARGPIVLDGELDDLAWRGPDARTGPFVAEGRVARPYSDARLLWQDGALLVALYAADEELVPGDTFRVVLGAGGRERALEVSVEGRVTGELPGARAAVEKDGTLGDPSDDDEEWVVELAIPLAALGLEGRKGERLTFQASRCDTPRGSPRVCAASRAEQRLVLD